MNGRLLLVVVLSAALLVPCSNLLSQTMEAPLVTGMGAWRTTPLFTVGETITGHTPPGILDGIGVRRVGDIMEVYVNHEMHHTLGMAYSLANGAALKGARITRFEVDVTSQKIISAGIAYDRVRDRNGALVTDASQLGPELQGVNKMCSAALFKAGTGGLVDDVYFTGEESYNGQAFALDVEGRELWCLPWLGRAAFENLAVLGPPRKGEVAILIGDDSPGAPLYLYIGEKDHYKDNTFIDRNGLAFGRLHVFVAADGSTSPQQFNGTGNRVRGSFKPIGHHDPATGGHPGRDLVGFADHGLQYAMGDAVGMFRFSRPEDVAVDPERPNRAVFASTGRGSMNPLDDWGTTYVIDVDLNDLTAELSILYDGDDAGAGRCPHPDFGLRSPDNLAWSGDGYIYIQEDRSTALNTFGGTSGMEASVWRIHPENGHMERVAMVDRAAKLPPGQYDGMAMEIGAWETSGIVDVSEEMDAPGSEVWFLLDVQAHGVYGGAIHSQALAEGGQLLLLKGPREGMERTSSGAGIQVYPVPVSSLLNIRHAGIFSGDVELVIMDSQGRKVLERKVKVQEGQETSTINVEHLVPGLYMIEIRSTGRVAGTRFVKEAAR
jgi:2',3'-cyclic-nucleotide 2'-phosphodiesterase / 3'-nucleotidase / 5'-nucleotidase